MSKKVKVFKNAEKFKNVRIAKVVSEILLSTLPSFFFKNAPSTPIETSSNKNL